MIYNRPYQGSPPPHRLVVPRRPVDGGVPDRVEPDRAADANRLPVAADRVVDHVIGRDQSVVTDERVQRRVLDRRDVVLVVDERPRTDGRPDEVDPSVGAVGDARLETPERRVEVRLRVDIQCDRPQPEAPGAYVGLEAVVAAVDRPVVDGLPPEVTSSSDQYSARVGGSPMTTGAAGPATVTFA